MAPSTIRSTIIATLLILSRLSAADDFNDLDSCTKSCLSQSNCAESDTKCICEASNTGYLKKLVDCLNTTSCDHDVDINNQILSIQTDCKNSGNNVDAAAVVDAQVYDGVDVGNVEVGSDDSTHTLTSVPKYEKTTISVMVTNTMVITSEVETTDSNGNDIKTDTTITSTEIDTSESVSTTGTSYITVTYTVEGGTVSAGDGTVSVGGDYGTVVVGPGSVVVGGGAGATTTSSSSSSGNGKGSKSTASDGATATSSDGSSMEEQSVGSRTLVTASGIGAAVMVFAIVGGLIFML